MNIKQILSQRSFRKWPSYQIVYEWEDEISSILECNISSKNFFSHHLSTLYGFDQFLTKKNSLIFDMNASSPLVLYGRSTKNIFPYIIDFFPQDNELHRITKAYKDSKCVIVSSRQAYNFLKKLNQKINFKHIGLSLPSKWIPNNEIEYNDKPYDIVMAGRPSSLFLEFFNKYKSLHPDIKIVTRKIDNDIFNFYGPENEYLGPSISRDNYMDMLKKSKVFLYSTPGIHDNKITNGFNPVTPRFLEALSAGCNILLQYNENEDTDYYELNKFCPPIKSYEQFEELMDKARNEKPDFERIKAYLLKHSTAQRAQEILNI